MCVKLNELSEDWIGAHVYSIHNFRGTCAAAVYDRLYLCPALEESKFLGAISAD